MSASSPATPPRVAPPSAVWPRGPREPSLAPGAVHVWRVELSGSDEALAEALSSDERERARALAGERASARWQRSRELLRALLGRYLTIAPDAVELIAGANGKPELAGRERNGRPALFFNLAHSEDIAVYAFTRDAPIGVDVQLERDGEPGRHSDRVALARRIWGDAAAQRLAALALDAREREFLRLWTRFEADCKRTGDGIGEGSVRARRAVESDGVDGAGAGPSAHSAQDSPWIAELDVGPRGAAAVACETAPRELRCFDWR